MAVEAPTYVFDEPTTYVADGDGYLVRPYSLEYAVFDASTPAKRAQPVQVYPPAGRVAVDFASYPTGDEVAVGYYRAQYSPGPSDPRGRHYVRWYSRLTDTSQERTWRTEWDVLDSERDGQRRYGSVSDFAEAGYPTVVESDALDRLALASEYVEMYTGRVFVPEPKRLVLDGTGRNTILLGEEVVAVHSVAEKYLGTWNPADVVVFNRHLTQRLLRPDDREAPRLRMADVVTTESARFLGAQAVFPEGRSNVVLDGVFGYTEWDGSPMGRTPAKLRRAVMLLAGIYWETLGRRLRGGLGGEGRVAEERTRDQAVRYTTPSGVAYGTSLVGAFTGVPEVDNILASLVRPPSMAGV